jgi:hypothetical protein
MAQDVVEKIMPHSELLAYLAGFFFQMNTEYLLKGKIVKGPALIGNKAQRSINSWLVSQF